MMPRIKYSIKTVFALLLIFLILAASAPLKAERPVFVDEAIENINMGDAENSKEILAKHRDNCWGLEPLFKATCFVNSDKTEKVTFITHPGSESYAVDIFRLEKYSDDDLPVYPFKLKKFTTGKGIILGMDKKQLISILGKPIKLEADVYKYRSVNDLYVQKKYKMPVYYGKYYFEKENLVKLEFGLEYP